MQAIKVAKNRRAILAIAALLCLYTARSTAQTLTISCADAMGRPVQSVQRTNSVIAKAALDESERPIIDVDSRRIEGVNAQERLFVYAHECEHHALGHDVNQPYTAAQEQAADCQAIQVLTQRAGLTSNDVIILQTQLRDLPAGASRRLPWRMRPYDLEGCLPEVSAQRAAASRPRDVSANDCLLHNDAENAIIRASRDRLTIDGLYIVANRCTRALRCTFTIQLGTLPDSDADAGSWRNFHVQKTMIERYDVAAGAARSEHEFRAMVDTVPARESVDFRVVPECQ
jgi:hypothetical protein